MARRCQRLSWSKMYAPPQRGSQTFRRSYEPPVSRYADEDTRPTLRQQQKGKGKGKGSGKSRRSKSRAPPLEFYKTSLCRNYVGGSCAFGQKCAFAHGYEELRPGHQSKTSLRADFDDEDQECSIDDICHDGEEIEERSAAEDAATESDAEIEEMMSPYSRRFQSRANFLGKGKARSRGGGRSMSPQTGFRDVDPQLRRKGYYFEPEVEEVPDSERFRQDHRSRTTKTPNGTQDQHTEECWKVLGQTLWIKEEYMPGTRRRKSYYLYWENDLLCVRTGHGAEYKLPSIDGGLRWGIGKKRSEAPKCTLAFEDAGEDRLAWRGPDGSISHTWLLQEVNVEKFDVDPQLDRRRSYSLDRRLRGDSLRRASRPIGGAAPRSASKRQERRRPVSREVARRKTPHYEDLVTDDQYRYLAGSTWVDENQIDSSGEVKKYLFEWIGNALYVTIRQGTFPLPSIEGGLRWGAPGPRNAAPKYTLADTDIEPERLLWRGSDGSVVQVWYLQDGPHPASFEV